MDFQIIKWVYFDRIACENRARLQDIISRMSMAEKIGALGMSDKSIGLPLFLGPIYDRCVPLSGYRNPFGLPLFWVCL